MLSPRARALLLALARCRLLSFAQLRRLVLPDRAPQRVGQVVAQLEEAGWLRVWEDVSRVGGRPRYALPTRRALAVALPLLAEGNGATARLAAQMLPQYSRRPLALAPHALPAFLAHQREVNDLLLAYDALPDTRVCWATAWDRPFPVRIGDLTLPQPDYVLVLERGGSASLVFGEHDRGNESLAHFRRTKTERYAALAAQPPQVLLDLLGFSSFSVWVTVLDARSGAPGRRLARLARVASDAGASDVMAFTLAGWAAATPAAPIWYCDGTTPDDAPVLRAVPVAAPAKPGAAA